MYCRFIQYLILCTVDSIPNTMYCRFNPKTGLLDMSYAQLPPDQLGPGGGLFLSLVSTLGLAKVERGVGERKKEIRVNNLTIINFVLKFIGPTHERTLTIYMMCMQVFILNCI